LAKQESTYGAGHRRKFCTARLASMAHFVSVFCPSSDSCVDIAASYGQREQWSRTRWLHRTGSHIKSHLSAATSPRLRSGSRSEITRYHNSDVRKVGSIGRLWGQF
jgi:hypothetical protein